MYNMASFSKRYFLPSMSKEGKSILVNMNKERKRFHRSIPPPSPGSYEEVFPRNFHDNSHVMPKHLSSKPMGILGVTSYDEDVPVTIAEQTLFPKSRHRDALLGKPLQPLNVINPSDHIPSAIKPSEAAISTNIVQGINSNPAKREAMDAMTIVGAEASKRQTWVNEHRREVENSVNQGLPVPKRERYNSYIDKRVQNWKDNGFKYNDPELNQYDEIMMSSYTTTANFSNGKRQK